jgi:hypothetical protein
MRGKQKEIRAREIPFIQVARETLLREGYQGVPISRMDGYGWWPLQHEWDYEATARRARAFPLNGALADANMDAAGGRGWLRSVEAGT